MDRAARRSLYEIVEHAADNDAIVIGRYAQYRVIAAYDVFKFRWCVGNGHEFRLGIVVRQRSLNLFGTDASFFRCEDSRVYAARKGSGLRYEMQNRFLAYCVVGQGNDLQLMAM